MKKIPLLVLLTVSSVAAVAIVSASASGSAFSTIADGCHHDGYHYSYVAATSSTNGRREYWKCCICNEVFFEEPKSGTFLDGSATYFGESSAVIEAHEHTDYDRDGKCDEFENGCLETDWVEGITLTIPSNYLGPCDSMIITANVEGHGNYSEEVEWHVTKSNGSTWTKYPADDVSTIFTYVDNKDGTLTLTGVDNLYKAEYSIYVYATSKANPSISSSKTEKVYYQAWNSTKRGTLNSYFGDGNWHTIPFFPSMTLSIEDDILNGYTTYGRTLDDLIDSFDNHGEWTQVSLSYTGDATYELVKNGYVYTCYIDDDYYSKSKYYPEITIIKEEVLTSFPSTEIGQVITGLGAVGTLPEFNDGNAYKIDMPEDYYELPTLVIYCDDADDALSSYLSILNLNDFFLYKTDHGYEYYGVEGETLSVCPYVQNNKLMIELDCEASPIAKPMTEWPAQEVATALGDLAEETAVAATGTIFNIVSQGTNEIKLKINGSDEDYMSKLTNAGYTKIDNNYYHPVYQSQTKTIDVTVDIDYYFEGVFTITLKSHLAPGVTTTFPLEEVKNIIGSTESDNIIAAEGSKFTLVKNDDYDVSVTVEGGDMSTFVSALTSAEFDSLMAGSYFKGNLGCDVSSNTGSFTITYYLLSKPQPADDIWSKLSGDCGTLTTPLKINDGMGGKQNFVVEFDNGSIVGYTKNNRTKTLVTLTGDTNGLPENQLHLTGIDVSYNYVDYDFVIEYDSSTETISLVVDNSKSNW